MNILFFLTPKKEVAYIYSDNTLRQALGKFEYYRYSALPIIDVEGHYVGTVTEGDILWHIKGKNLIHLRDMEKISVLEVKRKFINNPVHIDSSVEDIIQAARTQNFVPVVDDNSIFIGIITRQEIMKYCVSKLQEKQVIV